jgi:hypothetical protein
MSIRLSASANGTRNAGIGGGQYLLEYNAFSPVHGASVSTRTSDKPASSTADYYHLDGLHSFAPYDLNAMGTWGQDIATAKGYRYVWFIGCDHPGTGSGTEGGWSYDAAQIYAAFSNDPRILPDPSTMRAIIPYQATVPGAEGDGTHVQPFNICFVYDPDDASFPGKLYCEMGDQAVGSSTVNALPCVLWKLADFDTQATCVGRSHDTNIQFGATSYQQVYRIASGDWISFGLGYVESGDTGDRFYAKWTSTDGVTFTRSANTVRSIGNRNFNRGGKRFLIGAQYYEIMVDDDRTAGNGMYVALVPTDSDGNVDVDGTPSIVRLSSKYDGTYPTTKYLQLATSYVEDGIVFIYALHGFFGDTGLTTSALPESGGGLNEQYIDCYAYVFDATAAQASAPCGVKTSCSAGVVTISWDDVPSGRSYRIKRGTDGATFGTTVSSSVTGTSITDSPTVGSVYYYQVTSLHGGVEQASRVVSTYVS